MSEKKIIYQKLQSNYDLQTRLGQYEIRFGSVADRKQPKSSDEDDGSSGGVGGLGIPYHIILGDAVQFSGDFERENVVPSENTDPDVKEQLENRLEAKLANKLAAQNKATPKLER